MSSRIFDATNLEIDSLQVQIKSGGTTGNLKDSIEDNRLYLSYSCGTVPTTTLKYEHPSITPWSRW